MRFNFIKKIIKKKWINSLKILGKMPCFYPFSSIFLDVNWFNEGFHVSEKIFDAHFPGFFFFFWLLLLFPADFGSSGLRKWREGEQVLQRLLLLWCMSSRGMSEWNFFGELYSAA